MSVLKKKALIFAGFIKMRWNFPKAEAEHFPPMR